MSVTANRLRQLARPGLVFHVWGNLPIDNWIIDAEMVWQRRICHELGVPFVIDPWGCHDGLIVQSLQDGGLYVGESLASKGSVMTPLESYCAKINNCTRKVRLFEIIGITTSQELDISREWQIKVKGRPYNYLAFADLAYKSFCADWSEIVPTNWYERIMKRIGDHAAGVHWADWCTEGVRDACEILKPDIDIFQYSNPTPLTTEHVAGLLPRKLEMKTTLSELT